MDQQRPSYCDRRNGTFNSTPGARDRAEHCQSCGAGRHWERGAFHERLDFNTPPGTEYVLYQKNGGRPRGKFFTRLPRAPNRLWPSVVAVVGVGDERRVVVAVGASLPPQVYPVPDGRWTSAHELVAQSPAAPDLIPDTDGTPISVHWLLQTERNYGKRKNVLMRLSEQEREDSTGGSGRVWGDNDGPTVEFLRGGGWFTEKAGATGGKRGRPRKGIAGEDMIGVVVRRASDDADAWLIRRLVEILAPAGLYGTKQEQRRAFKRARGLIVACLLNRNVNTKAFADLIGRDDRTIRAWRQDGEDWINERRLYLYLTLPRDTPSVGPGLLLPNPPANSPKGGREEMNATLAAEVIQRLDRLQEDVTEIKQSNYRQEFRQLDERQELDAETAED